MLYKYLTENYRENEPIFVSDINLEVSSANLRRMFKVLCDTGKIKRFDTGIYYIPKKGVLKNGVPLAADEVAIAKYIEKNGKIDGYYSGYTFANQLGISTQVPFVEEIVTNNASTRVRKVKVRNKKILLRKSRMPINNENYIVLQLLDLLKDLEQYYDVEFTVVCERLAKYVRDEKIEQKEIDKYIGNFPEKIYKNIYETRLYNAFA
ncbi:MAG: DUF6088 family protein [Phascolarctobacterium sp.]|nr:DUF6088 family protein [Phascolarctobacterium sp.]